jgi:hypothetical protein
MKMLGVLCLALFVASAAILPGGKGVQPSPGINVHGHIQSTGPLTIEWLQSQQSVTVEWGPGVFRGIPLESILNHYGLNEGMKSADTPVSEKRSGYRHAILLTGRDGFQVAYSFAELASVNGAPTKAFLVWELDGAPLSEEMGPVRLINTTDHEGARSIYQIASMEIIELRRASSTIVNAP